MKEFIPGVTRREDIPVEMGAHEISEESLWWQVEPEPGGEGIPTVYPK